MHLPPLPGDPNYESGGVQAVEGFALRDAEAFVAGGADALIVENFGSVPFGKGELAPHAVATLARVARACKLQSGLAVGVNCLRNDARAAIGIAAAAELDFVRINVHTGVYATDQGLIEGAADRTLRYRRELGVEHIEIFADVFVKHAAPVGATSIAIATEEVFGRGLADGVIVTGTATGKQAAVEDVRAVRGAAGSATVLIGSGITPENAASFVEHADGLIVGSWFRGGELAQPVQRERVADLAAAVRGSFD